MEDPTNLVILKLDYMRILSSHEHYLTLNLPFTSLVASPLDAMSLSSLTNTVLHQSYTITTELSDAFRQQHYLVGIILCDLVTALRVKLVPVLPFFCNNIIMYPMSYSHPMEIQE